MRHEIFGMLTPFPCVLSVFPTWLAAFVFQFAVQLCASLVSLTIGQRVPACKSLPHKITCCFLFSQDWIVAIAIAIAIAINAIAITLEQP